MAVEFFRSEAVDYSVIEVGMGGRFDATNVINNVLVSVVTNVDLDHMQFLGNTRAEIAFEKSGILKPGVPVVTTCDGDALAVVLKRAAALHCKVYVLGDIDMKQGDKIFQTFTVQCYSGGDAGSSGDTRSGSKLPVVDLPVVMLKEKFFAPLLDGGKFQAGLPGAYQRINVITAVLALWASGCVEFNDDNIKSMQSGLLAARWAGRFEIVESEKLILDGAHNPHGAAALRASLLDKFSRQARFVFILSCFENKNAEQLLGSLVSSGDMVITFNAGDNIEGARKMHSPETLMAIARNIGAQACHAETFEKAVEAGRLLGDQFAPYLVVAGSFVSVRAAINMLMLRKSAGEL
jgi:dihydrofolate synthase/folylpolyglutamate synthase